MSAHEQYPVLRFIGTAATWLALPSTLGFALSAWIAEHGSILFFGLGVLLGVCGVVCELALMWRERHRGRSEWPHWSLTGFWSSVAVGALAMLANVAEGNWEVFLVGPFVAVLVALPAFATAYLASRFTHSWVLSLPSTPSRPVVIQRAPTMAKCSHCLRPVDFDAPSCPHCGFRFNASGA